MCFTLIFTEAYAEKIKIHAYYYGATLFVYEFIGLLSMVTYFYSLLNVSSTDKWSFGKHPFVELSYFLPIGFILCAHWIKNTFVHISVFQCKLHAVSGRHHVHFEDDKKPVVNIHFLSLSLSDLYNCFLRHTETAEANAIWFAYGFAMVFWTVFNYAAFAIVPNTVDVLSVQTPFEFFAGWDIRIIWCISVSTTIHTINVRFVIYSNAWEWEQM